MHANPDIMTHTLDPDVRTWPLARMAASPEAVWTPSDFADFSSRASVDKTLRRLAAAGDLQRIDKGLYDRRRKNGLTGCPTVPDHRAVIRAVTRRERVSALIDKYGRG